MPGFHPVDTKQSFPELEERVLERWRERDVFARSLANREGAEVWSFYEGPPTANGRPGSHHVLSRVFKDVYPRYRTMSGYRVPRKAGWDCHGLPVELEVEKELGIASKQEIEEYGIAEFNAALPRVGLRVRRGVEPPDRADRLLDRPRRPLRAPSTTTYIESVWWSLRRLWDEERLYEGHKVVPYCPRCGTALSSHEVALGYQDVEDPSIYVKLPAHPRATAAPAGESLLVWTTTPWTLPGNEAVAVAPDVGYVRARVERRGPDPRRGAGREGARRGGRGRRAVRAAPTWSAAATRARSSSSPTASAGGFPVLAGDFVTTEDGTGLVHIAPAFGEDDYAVAAANGIFDPTDHASLYNPVGLDGRFDERVMGFEGQLRQGPRGDRAR